MSVSTLLAQMTTMTHDMDAMAGMSHGDSILSADALNAGLLIIRVVVGLTIVTHGLNKIFGGGKIAGTAGWFASIGMKMPLVNAWMAALTEIGAGLLLAVGLLTPLAAGGLIAVMTVAMITSHIRNRWFIFNANGGGVEYVVVLALVCLGVAIAGPGQWSIDDKVEFFWEGWPGLVIALVAGLGGAALQLATFWRPPKPAAA